MMQLSDTTSGEQDRRSVKSQPFILPTGILLLAACAPELQRQGGQTVRLTENSPTSAALTGWSLIATDADTPQDQLIWSVTDDCFALLDSPNGHGKLLMVRAGQQFDFEAEQNSNGIVPVNVIVWDGTSAALISVPIQLIDVNDHKPVFSQSSVTVELSSARPSASLWQAEASDGDGTAAHSTLTYSIAAGPHRDLFRIDSKTGEIYSKHTLPAGGSWQLQIIASDGTFSARQTVHLSVPGLQITSPARLTVAEGAEASSNNIIYTASVSKIGSGQITWSLSGEDAAAFAINTDGQIWFCQSPDYETKSSYSLTLNASSGTHNASQMLSVAITEIDEKPTGIAFNPSPPTVSDGLSSAQIIASVAALDDALGTNLVLYLLGSGQLEYRASVQELWLKAGYEITHQTRLTALWQISGIGTGSGGDIITLEDITVRDLVDHKPHAFALSTSSASLDESTNSRTRLANLQVSDDAHGSWSASLSGRGAELFRYDPDRQW